MRLFRADDGITRWTDDAVASHVGQRPPRGEVALITAATIEDGWVVVTGEIRTALAGDDDSD